MSSAPQSEYPPQGGYPPQGPPPGGSRPTNGMAIGALVCGLLAVPLALFVFGGVLGLIAVVLGFIGLGKAKRMANSGKGMAITGIVSGILAIVLAIAVVAGLSALGNFVNDPANEEEVEQFLEDIETEG